MFNKEAPSILLRSFSNPILKYKPSTILLCFLFCSSFSWLLLFFLLFLFPFSSFSACYVPYFSSIGTQPDKYWFTFSAILFKYMSLKSEVWSLKSGLEKSAAIRPFATKKSHLASEKILLADSLATESCRLADRMATKFFSKRTTPMRTVGTWSRMRKVRGSLCRFKMQGSWPFGHRRSCLRVNPPAGSRCLPWDSPFETIWA